MAIRNKNPDKQPVQETAKRRSAKKRDTIGEIMSVLTASRPKTDKNGGVYISRMNQSDSIFSAVKEVVTSGISAFDDIIGPIPKGRVVEIYGPESSGKTEFIKKIVKRAYQKELHMYGKDGSLTKIEDDMEVIILYFDNESSIISDTNEIVIDGIKIDGILMQCDIIEMMWTNIDKVLDHVKELRNRETTKVKEAAKKREVYKPKKFLVVIVVDTIASMTSAEEYNSDWVGQDYPRMPRKLKEGFRRLVRRIANEDVIFIASNQANEKFEKKIGYGPTPIQSKYNAPGGKALKFFSSTRVCFEKQESKFVLDEDYPFQQGYVIAFVSTKNRIKKPLREGRMVLLFDSAPNIYGEMTPSGLNNEYSILETLIYLKFASFNEAKEIEFNFVENGVTPTTFGEIDAGEKISILGRADWVNFYAAHKEDVDLLWASAINYIQNDRGLTNIRAIDAQPDVESGEEVANLDNNGDAEEPQPETAVDGSQPSDVVSIIRDSIDNAKLPRLSSSPVTMSIPE